MIRFLHIPVICLLFCLSTHDRILAGPLSESSPKERTQACQQSTLRMVAERYVRTLGNRFHFRDVRCSGRWAVVMGEINLPQPAKNGPEGVGASLIFRYDGRAWIHETNSSSCGRFDSDHPESKPEDARIPNELYLLGCLVG